MFGDASIAMHSTAKICTIFNSILGSFSAELLSLAFKAHLGTCWVAAMNPWPGREIAAAAVLLESETFRVVGGDFHHHNGEDTVRTLGTHLLCSLT